MSKEREQTARRTYVEGAVDRDVEAAYRRRHRRLAGAGRFVRLVAEGGMGAVLEVRGEDGESFALKLIKESLARDDQAAGRFRRELASHRRLSASFQVPRLVPCLEFSDNPDGALVYGLFPFYSEGTLEDCLGRGLARPAALWILADAIEGLQSLHGLQYVHRDVHPANVLVEREGGRRRGVLGDLGVGIFLRSNTIFSDTQLDADRPRRVGHPGYIDPCSRASPEADLYALGATLYRILAGRPSAAGKPPRPEPLTLPEDADLAAVSPAGRTARRLLDRLTTPVDGRRFGSVREAREEIVRLAELLEAEEDSTPARRVAVGVRAGHSRPGRRSFGRRAALAALVASVVMVALHPRPLATSGETTPELHPPGVLTPGSSPGPPPPPSEASPPRSLTPEPSPGPAPPPLEASPPRALTPEPSPGPPLPPTRKRGATISPEDTPSPPGTPALGVGGAGPRGPGVKNLDVLIQARRYRRAEELARTLWHERPGDPEIAGRLALLATRNRPEAGWSEARAVLTAALLRHGDRGDLRLALARVSMEQGLAGSALRWLREAPSASSHRAEIDALRVTLERAGDRN